jgi:hypothetical protein
MQASAESSSNTNATGLKASWQGNTDDDEKMNDPMLLLKAMILPSV